MTDRPFPPIPAFNVQPIRWLWRHWWGYRGDRARHECPACGARGTYKAYGLWWGDRQVRRWLCKWCGFYDAVDGRFWAVMDREKGTWILPLEKVRENVDPASLASVYEAYQERVSSGDITTPKEIAARERFNPFL